MSENGFLSKVDKEFLRGEKTYASKQGRYDRRRAIRERTREALRDFSILCDELSADEREKIFNTDPHTIDQKRLEEDVAGAIQFLYMGLGGASGFTRPLKQGVANGETRLSPAVHHALNLAVRFSIDPIRKADVRAIVDLVEKGEWDRLESTDLLELLVVATQTDAIDFDGIRNELAENEWFQKYRSGTRRPIPGGNSTPLMDPEVFDREGIGDMAPEELREMFGEGYPSGSFPSPVYDGEKVFLPPPIGEPDGEIEVLEWIDGPGVDEE